MRKLMSDETVVVYAHWVFVDGRFREVKDASDMHCVHEAMLDSDCADCSFDSQYQDPVDGEEVSE